MPGNTSRRLLARLRDVMAGSGTAQHRLDKIVTLIGGRDGRRRLLLLRHAGGRHPGAVRHRRPQPVGGPQDAPAGRGRPGRRYRGPCPSGGARQCAVPSQLRLPARNRRGRFPVSDGRADPARRPGARRAGDPAQGQARLFRGGGRNPPDHRHGGGGTDRRRRTGQRPGDFLRRGCRPCCRPGSTASASTGVWRWGWRCCTGPSSPSARWSPRTRSTRSSASGRRWR